MPKRKGKKEKGENCIWVLPYEKSKIYREDYKLEITAAINISTYKLSSTLQENQNSTKYLIIPVITSPKLFDLINHNTIIRKFLILTTNSSPFSRFDLKN